MKRLAPPLVALLVGILVPLVPVAFGQSLSYPDDAGYENFRRTELETLELLEQDSPQRALAFHLLLAQRRLREAQLMLVKGKPDLVPPVLEDYQLTVQGAMAAFEGLPRSAPGSATVFESLEALGIRQQELLQNIEARAPPEIFSAVRGAKAASQRLRVLTFGTAVPGAPGLTRGPTGRPAISILEPQAPVEPGAEAEEATGPLAPEGTPRVETLAPEGEAPPTSPQEILGPRLRPRGSETHPRGVRRPGETSPRPRARDPIRRER